MHSNFEKQLYKKLFDKFSNKEYHVDFEKKSYTGDYKQLITALKNLDNSGILMILGKDDESITVELSYPYCCTLHEI